MTMDTPDNWDERAETAPAAVDLDSDPVEIQGEGDPLIGDQTDPLGATDSDLDSLVVEFVAALNARDMGTLADLLAEDAEAAFLGELSPEGVIQGLSDLMFERPDMVITRGDLGTFPIAATWLLDEEADHYQLAGFFLIELSETQEARIGRIDYVEELEDDNLVVEQPEDSESPGWEDWSAHDSS